MNKLTEQQKKQAFEFMNKHEGTDFSVLAIHLSTMFKIELTRDDVTKFYIARMFEG